MKKPPPPKELALHIALNDCLKAYLRQDWRHWHTPSGEHRDIRTAAKLKAMGVRPGIPDFVLLGPGGRAHFMELKRAGSGRLSEAQREFEAFCLTNGAPHVVVFDLHGATEALSSWGALRFQIRANGVPDLAEATA